MSDVQEAILGCFGMRQIPRSDVLDSGPTDSPWSHVTVFSRRARWPLGPTRSGSYDLARRAFLAAFFDAVFLRPRAGGLLVDGLLAAGVAALRGLFEATMPAKP